MNLKIVHHEKLLRLILSDSHSSTFSASVEIMLRFKEKDRDKKNPKMRLSLWHGWSFYWIFQAQKTTQERVIVERFSSSAQVRQPFLRQSTQLLDSVIHENVYDIILIEVSRKNWSHQLV